MNYLIILVLITIALVIHSLMLRHVLTVMDGLKERMSAQEDIISRVAAKQFEDSKHIATIEQDATELTERVKWNEREINKVKLFAYRQSTMKEVEDDAETAGV